MASPALRIIRSHSRPIGLRSSAGLARPSRCARARESSRTAGACAWLGPTKAARGRGHDDERSHLKIRNSWGAEWGDKGHCYIDQIYFERFQQEAWITQPERLLPFRGLGVLSRAWSLPDCFSLSPARHRDLRRVKRRMRGMAISRETARLRGHRRTIRPASI